jgi:hypothetical protein
MGSEMKFSLFSKILFEVSDPIALIECYCFQSDFYANYDLENYEKGRKVENVNAIGAMMTEKTLGECKAITEKTKGLIMFDYNKIGLDGFLELNDKTRNDHIKELNDKVIRELLGVEKGRGVRLSTATKVLHTLYPEIIPIIDRQLQKEYKKLDPQWTEQQSDEILCAYYDNFKKGDNWQNLNIIFKKISNNLPALTKVRVFDIIWWSYLKSKKLGQENKIKWLTIK